MQVQYLLAATAAIASLLPAAAIAQAPATTPTAPAATASAPMPMPPAGIGYRYWPRQFVQWVGPDLPYSMIALDIDDRGPQAIYDVILTDRATQKRVHYTNQRVEYAIDQAIGAEVYLVPMQFDQPADAANGSTYSLRFATEKNVPVQWQFVQGSDMSERGGGLSQVDLPRPVLLYREQGAVAGEGTALQVGSVTSTAEMWKEISQPPYFIAYHGAISQDVHELAFIPRDVNWTATAATAAMTPGSDWKLTNAGGHSLTAHVSAIANGSATIQIKDPLLGTLTTLDERQTPEGWSLSRARYAPEADNAKADHALTLNFTPGADAGALKFDVIAGRKTHLAAGTAALTSSSNAQKESWILTQPDWAHKAAVEASVRLTTASANPTAAADNTSAASQPAATPAH